MSNAGTTNPAPFAMTELAETLKGANGNSVASEILTRLSHLEDEIETYKRSGPSPNDYSQAEIIQAALVAAREIVLRTLSASGTAAH
jgi:hypothetical protein